MFDLSNKNIIITGASSGIGRSCAKYFSNLGANLLLIGRDIDRLIETRTSLLKPINSLCFALDLNEIDTYENAVSEFVKQFGSIDGLLHSAGMQITLPLRLHNKDVYDNQLSINTIAAFEACRITCKKEFFNPSGGSIIFISSVRASFGMANQVGYSASKGALLAGAKSLSIELGQRKIRVNTVSPGMVEGTNMTNESIKRLSVDWETKSRSEYPLGWVTPEAVANACGFLISDAAIYITGIDLIIDGGFSAK